MHDTPDLFRAVLALADDEDPQAAEAAIWRRFEKPCAVLVLDSTGFTRVAREKGIVHFLRLYLQMVEIAGPLIERRRCLSWRARADNLYAEFSTADDALEAALGVQLAVADARLPLRPGECFGVSIGIGFGRLLDGGPAGMFGDEMNLACKLGEDLAQGGETLLTAAAYSGLRRREGPPFERRESAVSGNTIAYYLARP